MEKEAPKPLPDGVRVHQSTWERKPFGFYSGSNVAESEEKTHPPRDEKREREEAIVRSTVEFIGSHFYKEEDYALIVKAVLDDSPEVIERIIQERRPK